MSRFYLSLLLLTQPLLSLSQNLVPNPSFEEFIECPNDQFQIENAIGWTSYKQTPDYFNSCDLTNFVGTPWSVINGYQPPFEGVGQAGFIAIGQNNQSREFIGASLSEPLIPGEDYYVSFMVARGFGGAAHSNCNCALNNLGIKFLSQPYSIDDPLNFDNSADLFFEEVIIDTTAWTQISGWVSPQESYSHFAIGNFFDTEQTEILNFNGAPFLKTYYFLDAVCVALDSTFCAEQFPLDVHLLGQQESTEPAFWPNPARDILNVTEQAMNSQLIIFNQLGEQVRSIHLKQTQINISMLEPGVYLIRLTNPDGIITSHRILKT